MDQAHSRDLHVIDNHRNDPLKKEGEKKKVREKTMERKSGPFKEGNHIYLSQAMDRVGEPATA